MRRLFWIPLLFLGACVQYPAIQEIRRVSVEEYRDSTLVLETLVVLENPNRKDIPLQAYSYEMRLYDEVIGSGADSNGLVLPGADTLHVPLQTELSLSTLEALFPKLVNDPEARIEIDGRYTFKLLNKEWTLRQKREADFTFDEILAGLIDGTAQDGGLEVRNLRLGEIGLLQTRLLMDIEVHNKLPLDYALEKINLKLYPNSDLGQSLGQWQKRDTLLVSRDSSVQFPVDFKLNNLALMSAIPDILSGNQDEHMKKMVLAGDIHLAVDDKRFVVPFQQAVGALLKSPLDMGGGMH